MSQNLTLVEAAKELGIAHQSLAAMIDQGKGPGIRVGADGNRFLIRREWMDRFKAGEAGFWSVAISGGVVIEQLPVSTPFLKRVS